MSYLFNGDSYIKPFDYKDIKMKNYTPLNISECKLMVDSVDPKYLDGIRYVILHKENKHYLGYYYRWSQNIYMFGNCDRWVFVHELAHHCQYERGDHFTHGQQHSGHFDECEDEIWSS